MAASIVAKLLTNAYFLVTFLVSTPCALQRIHPHPSCPPICSLPDDLLLLCLARVRGTSLGPGCMLLRAVCQRWRRLVACEAFFRARHALGRSSEWLLTLTGRLEGGLLNKIFDPATNKCQVGREEGEWMRATASRGV